MGMHRNYMAFKLYAYMPACVWGGLERNCGAQDIFLGAAIACLNWKRFGLSGHECYAWHFYATIWSHGDAEVECAGSGMCTNYTVWPSLELGLHRFAPRYAWDA